MLGFVSEGAFNAAASLQNLAGKSSAKVDSHKLTCKKLLIFFRKDKKKFIID